jgi:NDP-sugar pyrophosphorylase family protein
VVEPAALFRHDLRPALERVGDDPLAAVVYPLSNPAAPATTAVPLHGHASCGAAVLGAEAAQAVATLASAPELVVSGLVKLLRAFGARVTTSGDAGWCVRIDGVDDLLLANQLVLDELTASGAPRRRRLPGVDPRAIVDPTAELDCAIVRGPAIVGARAQLRDCSVGPYASIGEDALVEGVELERCVVCAHAVVRELGTRLEDSFVGSHASVSKDLRPPRALRLTVGEDADITLA